MNLNLGFPLALVLGLPIGILLFPYFEYRRRHK